MLRQTLWLMAVLATLGAGQAQAGVVPWAWDALFGPPGSQVAFWNSAFRGTPYPYGGYGYGMPSGGYYGPAMASTSYYGPASYGYGSYTANYGYPVSYGYSAGWGGNCGCDPCGCAAGNCGASYGLASSCGSCATSSESTYSPAATTGDSDAEPSEVVPQTFRKEPPIDEFGPTRGINDNGTNSNNSTTPNNTQPDDGGEILPGGGFLKPAPGDPTGGDANPFPGGGGSGEFRLEKPEASIEPVDVPSTVAQTFQPQRRRIVSHAGYRIPTVARLKVEPGTSDVSPAKLAAK